MLTNFPTRAPIGLIFGCLLAVLVGFPIVAVWYRALPPLDRFYLGEYISMSISQTSVGTVASFFHKSPTRSYYLLEQNGKPLVPGRPASGDPLFVRLISAKPSGLHDWLRSNIYRGYELHAILRTPLLVWLLVALFLLAAGFAIDFRRRKQAREGIKLRGPELMTRAEFNRATKGDGLTIYVQD
jgi:hypothetical protein